MQARTLAAALASGLISASGLILASQAVSAQTAVPPPSSTQTIPEKTPADSNKLKQDAAPAPKSGRSGSLSSTLNRSNGVITPKGDVDPGMKTPAPATGSSVTPVVPPSATGGQDAK